MERTNLKLIAALCILVILPAGLMFMTKLEGEKPSVVLSPFPGIGVSQTLSVSLTDTKSGIRRIWIGVLKDDREFILLKKDFPSGGLFGGGRVHEETLDIPIQPRALGITEGKATLRIIARDYSWRGWWNGNRTLVEKDVMVDTKRPRVETLNTSHSIRQGGADLVIYQVSEPCLENRIVVGKNFFPAYSCRNITEVSTPDPGEYFMAFIALDYSQGPGTDIFIEVTDLAGNKTRLDIPYFIGKRSFRKDRINISDRFLRRKMPEFPDFGEISQLEKFIKINKDLRRANYRQFIEIGEKTDKVLYWKGSFKSLPRSKKMASFGDHREYRYADKAIDHQVHLGLDQASIAHATVPAANKGKIAYAGEIGIYGQTIVIDHGFGLFSTYSHLSSFNVKKGQIVSRGEIIGRTGKTGLAGGDHLHFGILIHNTFVNPIEWFDRAWVRNISKKIKLLKSKMNK